MSKKDFRGIVAEYSPVNRFISTPADEIPESATSTSAMAQQQQEKLNELKKKTAAKAGKEREDRRLQIVVAPSLYKDMADIAYYFRKSAARCIKEAMQLYREAHKTELESVRKWQGKAIADEQEQDQERSLCNG